ncbi:MAG: DUF2868 domain-containing protein [Gammaproteobacteria bacterium]|nr:DUF2868 domain-containing protein [Gammaproteobacteria bacterium]MBT8134547.1 DUF2868 domain-containing protein [Gammaproteobacteria bacterium]NNJ50353.1 DUF2868 domain-containing protein [Gammaproteobacteria bacterium]
MAISKFDKQLQIEQIRYIETEHPLDCDAEPWSLDQSGQGDFEERLWRRAKCLIQQHDFSALLARAARVAGYAKALALILAVVLGALGTVYAVTDSQTINIYWLLLVLLGFNVVSMLLWLTGISLNVEGLTSGMLARLTSWLPGHLESKALVRENLDRKKAGMLADRAWLACSFSGPVGKWHFSKITHQLWLAYLFAGLFFLVLLLMVRQYDFAWGTTLLSHNVFVTLTESLSVPLDMLGFATPSAEQVQQTRIGSLQMEPVSESGAELRYLWAQFLIAALLCFGILPRFMLWCWSLLMYHRACRLFKLDYYLPYYIGLRQRMMPLASHSEVIDASSAPLDDFHSPALRPVSHTLPAEARWIAVELGGEIRWPLASIGVNNDLGQVVDRETLANIMQRLRDSQYPVIAIAVSSVRPPDRGVQRIIASLVSASEQRWLVLLQKNAEETVTEKRLASWYRLADGCGIPADHVISLIQGEASNEA